MDDAFISYSSKDLRSVEQLKQQLDESDFRVFLDAHSLRAGVDWPPQLGNALRRSRLLIVCWSHNAAVSKWVEAEINQALLMKKPIVPWLLDATALPPLLQKTHGIKGHDPATVVIRAAEYRRRHRIRLGLSAAAAVAAMTPVLWLVPHYLMPQTTTFRGHITDSQGSPIERVAIEADGQHALTGSTGAFTLVLAASPSARTLTVRVSKPGYETRTIGTQTDVPDLGLILEKAP